MLEESTVGPTEEGKPLLTEKKTVNYFYFEKYHFFSKIQLFHAGRKSTVVSVIKHWFPGGGGVCG